MKFFSTLILFLILSYPAIAQKVISEIKFNGLEKTERAFVDQFVQCKEGDTVDSASIEKDVQALRNLRIFSNVESRLEMNENNAVLIFDVDEAFTLTPWVDFGKIRENYYYQIGVVENNFLGYGNILGGYYKYYDRNTFEVFYKVNYLFGSRFGLRMRAANFGTFEPAYFSNGISNYKVDKKSFEAIFSYDFSKVRGQGITYILQAGGEYLFEQYDKDVGDIARNFPGPDYKSFNKYLFKTGFTVKNLDYYFHYLEGFQNEIWYEIVSDDVDGMGFYKIINEIKGFYRFTSTTNLAGRIRAGISTDKESPFVPFVVDSYINVRGAGNRVSRGTAEFTINFEVRQTLLQLSYGALQLVGFSDYSTLKPGYENSGKMFDSRNRFLYSGIGLRGQLFASYGAVLRLDYGFDMDDFRSGAFVFGLGQYF